MTGQWQSRQTQEAAAVAARAAADWRHHLDHCSQCSIARRRRSGMLCDDGRYYRQLTRSTAEQLEQERAADREPPAGQGELALGIMFESGRVIDK